MHIVNSTDYKNSSPNIETQRFLDNTNETILKKHVEAIAIPRHRLAEADNNQKVADYIFSEFERLGLTVYRQGEYQNIVACFGDKIEDAKIIIGAHYDSVPRSPGADDNASAVAGMLAAAQALSRAQKPPIAFIAFNQEEDGLLGSKDFVEKVIKNKPTRIEQVHILEMIGYCRYESGSQSLPSGLPIKISDIGDFLAILSNRDSNQLISPIMRAAATYTPTLPVKALKIFMGIEKFFPHLLRSDHSPFWEEHIPAFMWTDTSEFRNPNYHQRSDTPDTLDFKFLVKVTHLLITHIVEQLHLNIE